MKLTRSTLMAFALVLAMAVPAAVAAAPADKPAQPGPGAGPGYGHGPWGGQGFHALPQEKQDAFIKIMKEFRDKTHPVREQLWVKKTTLRALENNPKTEPQQIVTLVNEMSTLREQLYKERTALAERVKKEVGIDMPMMGRGFHRGGMGGCGMVGGDGFGPRGHGKGGPGWGHRGGYGGHGGMDGRW